MDKVTVLKEAKTLISNASKWTQCAYARDSEGLTVNVHDEEACCFCAMGAIRRVVGPLYLDDRGAEPVPGRESLRIAAVGAMRLVAYEEHKRDPIGVNDQLGHEAVMTMFDRAIEQAEKEAAA